MSSASPLVAGPNEVLQARATTTFFAISLYGLAFLPLHDSGLRHEAFDELVVDLPVVTLEYADFYLMWTTSVCAGMRNFTRNHFVAKNISVQKILRCSHLRASAYVDPSQMGN